MDTKILLLEDDLSMQTLLKTILGFEGFEAIIQKQQETLEQVLEGIQREQPAVVLMDVNLSRLNGFDVLKAIRAHPDIGKIPVVMSSGMDYGERCRLEGANGFLPKPFSADELIRVIRQAFGS